MANRAEDLALSQAFLDRLSAGLSHVPQLESVLALLEPDAWFRDLLVFSPLISSRRGRQNINSYLAPLIPSPLVGGQWTNFRLENTLGFPKQAKVGQRMVVKLCFTFKAERAWCKGYATIGVPAEENDSAQSNGLATRSIAEPKAMLLTFMLKDWKGHEEVVFEERHITGSEWQTRRASLKNETEMHPEVLVVGAGQSGLHTAARLESMGFRVLLLEKEARVGDLWRKRYPTLTLHATKRYCEFLYLPYPATYPTFLPGLLLADWLETYPRLLDLKVWTSSTIVAESAFYSSSIKRWKVTVRKSGSDIVVEPKYLVWATGQHGLPNIPPIPADSTASIIHSSEFKAVSSYKGSKVLIVGAATSALDISQALYHAGADVTVLQRSSTSVVSHEWMRKANTNAYPDDLPIEVCDERSASQPVGMSLANSDRTPQLALDKALLEKLKDAGFQLNDGPDARGQQAVLYEKFAGFYVDVGCSQLLIDKKIKLLHGSITSISGKQANLDSGETVYADHVILATGFQPINSTIASIFGAGFTDSLKPVWGLDAHGELRFGYGPSGQTGFYLALGTFPQGRTYSKYLAMYLRAVELGYVSEA